MGLQTRDSRPERAELSVWPVGLAVGIAVLLVGLVVDLRVIAPLGGAITLGFGFLWLRSLARPHHVAADNVEPGPATATPHQVRRTQAELGQSHGEQLSRDRFLKRATIGLGGLLAAAVALPAAGLAILPTLERTRRRAIDIGPIPAFSEGTFVVSTFLSDPQAGDVSRRSAYVRYNGLLRGLPSFTILSSRCTHVGCPTQPLGLVLAGKGSRPGGAEAVLAPTLGVTGFSCPCHGSAFDGEGNRTAGPAPRALDRYEFSIRNGRLVLGQLYSVSTVDGSGAQARIHAYRQLGDGQPAAGLESYLYPLQPPQ